MATPNATTPNPTGGRAVLRSLSEMQLARILPPVGTVVRQLPGDARRGAGQLTRRTMQNLLSDPPLPVLTLLRRFRPRMSVKRLTLVTRGQDVIDVLTDADRYRVTPYATLMRRLAGPFALGLDGEDHRIARSRIAQTLERIDTAELGRWADAYATWLVADARAEGRIDLVTEYAQPLAARFVAEYLGVPEPAPDPNEPERGTSSWAGRFFEGCFLNLAGDRVVARRAESAAHELRKWISAAVDARTADDLSPDRTVLDRLVRADPQDPHGVTTDLIGLVVATIPMIARLSYGSWTTCWTTRTGPPRSPPRGRRSGRGLGARPGEPAVLARLARTGPRSGVPGGIARRHHGRSRGAGDGLDPLGDARPDPGRRPGPVSCGPSGRDLPALRDRTASLPRRAVRP